jgi:hypothetical protein
MGNADPDLFRELQHLSGKIDGIKTDPMTGVIPIYGQMLDLYLPASG